MELLIEILKTGGVILYPTDTIWGIGCDATNLQAIQKIFDIKKRDAKKSPIILVESEKRLQDLVNVPPMAWEIMDLSEKPVTIVYDNPRGLPKELLAEDGSIGIRLVKDLFCTVHKRVNSSTKYSLVVKSKHSKKHSCLKLLIISS